MRISRPRAFNPPSRGCPWLPCQTKFARNGARNRPQMPRPCSRMRARSRLPTANELEGAHYEGRKIAETAIKLHG